MKSAVIGIGIFFVAILAFIGAVTMGSAVTDNETLLMLAGVTITIPLWLLINAAANRKK